MRLHRGIWYTPQSIAGYFPVGTSWDDADRWPGSVLLPPHPEVADEAAEFSADVGRPGALLLRAVATEFGPRVSVELRTEDDPEVLPPMILGDVYADGFSRQPMVHLDYAELGKVPNLSASGIDVGCSRIAAIRVLPSPPPQTDEGTGVREPRVPPDSRDGGGAHADEAAHRAQRPRD